MSKMSRKRGIKILALSSVVLFVVGCAVMQKQDGRWPASTSFVQKIIGRILGKEMDVDKYPVEQVGTRVNIDHHYFVDPKDRDNPQKQADHKEKKFNELLSAEKMDFALLLAISEHRKRLLKQNLHNTGVDIDESIDCGRMMSYPHRTTKGQCYFHGLEDRLARDPEKGRDDKKFASMPRVGDSEQKFGRNIEKDVINETLEKYGVDVGPNPQLISEKLLMRKDGKIRAAPPVNILVAAWLQAQNHDWFSHGKNRPIKENPIAVPGHPTAAKNVHGDSQYAQAQDFTKGMLIPRTAVESDEQKSRRQDENAGYNYTSRNNVTHWWDASHIYGSDQATIDRMRTNPVTGKKYDADPKTKGFIAVDMQNKRLYYDQNGLPITGFHDNWWVGLELIHSLFAMEHNYVAGQLAKRNPGMDAERIFQTARMIVAALIAKIHTIEWTPATLDNHALHAGMYANWHGLKGARGIEFKSTLARRAIGVLSESMQHAISGLTGEYSLHLYNVPFTLTEEFVAVYRMHPLLPERIDIWEGLNAKGRKKKSIPVEDTVFRKTKAVLDSTSTTDLMYGFGTGHPGLVVTHNYPTFMRNFIAERNLKHGCQGKGENERCPGSDTQMDMGAMDIVRDRERGVPRYNQFRRALGLPPVSTFDQLVQDKEDAEILREVYGQKNGEDNVDELDLLVGNLAEKRYHAYAFGNTQFFIFALMASRRLMGDPFFSDYYTPKYYTDWGFNHVEYETMAMVIKRHYPELAKVMKDKDGKEIQNAFRPWAPVYDDVKATLANLIKEEAKQKPPEVDDTF